MRTSMVGLNIRQQLAFVVVVAFVRQVALTGLGSRKGRVWISLSKDTRAPRVTSLTTFGGVFGGCDRCYSCTKRPTCECGVCLGAIEQQRSSAILLHNRNH